MTSADHAALGPALAAAGAVSACVAVTLVDPNVAGNYPTCPFLALTGRWCPACGSLRGLRALARGEVVAAADLNALLVLAVPFLVYSWAAWAVPAFTTRALPALRLSGAATWGVLFVVLTFWLVRNLPWAPLSVLAP